MSSLRPIHCRAEMLTHARSAAATCPPTCACATSLEVTLREIAYLIILMQKNKLHGNDITNSTDEKMSIMCEMSGGGS